MKKSTTPDSGSAAMRMAAYPFDEFFSPL